MSYRKHMAGYDDIRTLYQTDSLYHWVHGNYFPPVLVEVSPTHRCNQRCRYCYSDKAGRKNEIIDNNVLVDIFDQVADCGSKAMLIQGTGEPLLHPALPDAVCKAAGRISMGLTTNGVLFTPELQERMLPHLAYVRFSVLDYDPERYAYLHGCPIQQWEALHKNLEYCIGLRKKSDLPVALWATVYLHEGNFHDAAKIVRFYKDLGLDYIVVQEATYTEYSPAGREEHASQKVSDEEINRMKSEIMLLNDDDFKVKIRFPINDDSYFVGLNKNCWQNDFCQGVRFYTIIASDGEIYPCWRFWGQKEFSYGSIYRHTFDEIWRDPHRLEIERHVNTVPPSGDECEVCNITKLNEILHKYRSANSVWKDFLI